MCIYIKNKKQEREKMKEEGVDDAMEDKGVGKVGGGGAVAERAMD